MKALVLLLACCLISPYSFSKTSEANKRSAGNETPEPQHKPENPRATTAIGECFNCFDIHDPNTHTDQTEPYNAGRDSLYRKYLLATVIGVGGGIIGIFILILQTIATHRAADAANKTADSLIKSERAWILVEMPEMPDPATNPPDPVGLYWIRPIIRNKGKTIAEIRRIRALIRVHNEGEFLPPEPQYPVGQGATLKTSL